MPQVWVPTRRKQLALSILSGAAALVFSVRGSRYSHRDKSTSAQNILVMELWNIGDVVLMLPFLASLRTLFPDASVTLLAGPHARELLGGSALVDDFIATDLAWAVQGRNYNPFAYDWRELFRVRREMRRRSFDLAFGCRMHAREHVVLALSGAHERVGFALGHGDRLLTHPVPVTVRDRHKAEDWLELLRPFGGPIGSDQTPRLVVSRAEREWATAFLAQSGISPGETIIGIHPGASTPEKRWPLEKFRETAAAIVQQGGSRILAFVDPVGYGASLGEVQGISTARVSLREMMALTERCTLLLCNDSGPMHIAGALGVPTISLFIPEVASWFAPLGEGHENLGLGSDVESVVTAVLKQIRVAPLKSPVRDERLG